MTATLGVKRQRNALRHAGENNAQDFPPTVSVDADGNENGHGKTMWPAR